MKEIKEKILIGIENADAIISTGGTSVGHLDLVPKAINKISNINAISIVI